MHDLKEGYEMEAGNSNGPNSASPLLIELRGVRPSTIGTWGEGAKQTPLRKQGSPHDEEAAPNPHTHPAALYTPNFGWGTKGWLARGEAAKSVRAKFLVL